MVFGLLSHSRSHESFWIGDGSSLLAAASSSRVNGMIANDASHFVATVGEVLVRVGIRCNGSLRFQKGNSFRYATPGCRLYRLIRIGGDLGWAGI